MKIIINVFKIVLTIVLISLLTQVLWPLGIVPVAGIFIYWIIKFIWILPKNKDQ